MHEYKSVCIILLACCGIILTMTSCAAQQAQQAQQSQQAPRTAPKATPQPAPKAAPPETAPAPKTAAQLAPEDLKNQPVQMALLIMFLNKYGYKSYNTVNREGEQLITYQVQDPKTKEITNYAIIYLPKGQLLRMEAYGLADVPSDKNQLNLLYQKLTELNSARTLGKFCLDADKKKVRYAHYRTVVGGLCYADFQMTLRMMEFIVINDGKALKELKP
jgi:hypothetical protein